MLTWPVERRGTVGGLVRGWRVGNKAKGTKSHLGLDVRAPVGTTVRAVDAGVVVATSSSSGGGCGVFVEHTTDAGAKWWSEGLHLSAYFVGRGEHVTAGQAIALSGNTGTLSTGPHLHQQFRVSGGWLRAHAGELGLAKGVDYAEVRTKKGAALYFVNPALLLLGRGGVASGDEDDDLDELAVDDELVEPPAAAGLSLDDVVHGLAALGEPSPLRVKAWCTWKGQQAAGQLLVAGLFVGLGLGLVRVGKG